MSKPSPYVRLSEFLREDHSYTAEQMKRFVYDLSVPALMPSQREERLRDTTARHNSYFCSRVCVDCYIVFLEVHICDSPEDKLATFEFLMNALATYRNLFGYRLNRENRCKHCFGETVPAVDLL